MRNNEGNWNSHIHKEKYLSVSAEKQEMLSCIQNGDPKCSCTKSCWIGETQMTQKLTHKLGQNSTH